MKKYNLFTYESIVAQNCGYATTSNAVDFINKLTKLIEEFSSEIGVSKESIYWKEVTKSDMYLYMLIIYAKVEPDWQPTSETDVWDENRDERNYPYLCTSLQTYMAGSGHYVNINENPPRQPHNLFQKIVITK